MTAACPVRLPLEGARTNLASGYASFATGHT